MEVTSYEKNANIVIEIKGDVDINTVRDLKAAIFDALNTNKKRFIINLENVNYMDSSGIGVLIITLKKTHITGGEFYLCNVPEHIKKILKLTQIHKIFKFCTKEDFNL